MFSLISGLPSPFSADDFSVVVRMIHRYVCRCPTPPRRACGLYGLSLFPPACCRVPSRHLRGLPVLVSEVSRRAGGLRLRRTVRDARAYASRPCCLPPSQGRRRPDCAFSKLNTPPTYTPVYASLCTSRCPAQNSRPSGSLLLSRKALSSSTSDRFIPAHRIGDLASTDQHQHIALSKERKQCDAERSPKFLLAGSRARLRSQLRCLGVQHCSRLLEETSDCFQFASGVVAGYRRHRV